MDINDLRGISTAVLLVSFIALSVWAFSRKRKKAFDEAARLPFADEEPARRTRDAQQQARQARDGEEKPNE